MDALTISEPAIGLYAIVSVIYFPTYRGRLAPVGQRQREARARIGDERAKAVRAQMRRGLGVDDPDEAELVFAGADALETVRSANRPFDLGGRVMLLLFLLAGVVGGDRTFLVGSIVALALLTTLGLLGRRQRMAYGRSAAATRALLVEPRGGSEHLAR